MKAMEMKRYKIDFRPASKFFFSDENRYRLKSDGNKSKLSMDYFQVSRKFPQQSTILGALRYLKLLSIGQIPISDKTKAEDNIGKSSFIYGRDIQDFISICNISPVGIGYGSETYYPNSFDVKSTGERAKLNQSSFSLDSRSAYTLDGYDEKEGISHILISESGSVKKYDEIFVSVESVGIKKNDRNDSPDSFYKQTSYMMTKGFSFRVEADLAIEGLDRKHIIPIGADGHLFIMSFEMIDPVLENSKKVDFNYIKLTSDSIIQGFDENAAAFSISESTTFRYLRSKVVQNNSAYYHSKPYSDDDKPLAEDKFGRSIKYMMLKRGSVFWFSDHGSAAQLAGLIDQEANMQGIGYNHYETEKINF